MCQKTPYNQICILFLTFQFSYLNNWYGENPMADTFTLSLWFFQTDVGYNEDKEGMFGNGDCHQVSTTSCQRLPLSIA